MKKEKIFNLIKIIIPGVIFSVGIAYLLAWGPSASPPDANAPKPINISGTNQVKGSGNSNGSLLDVKGALAINNTFLVSGDAVFADGLILGGLNPQGSETRLCADPDGVISYCDTAPVIILPTISTTLPTNVGTTSATSGGTVTSPPGAVAVITRGVAWSKFTAPTISDSHTADGGGPGTFISSITGLQPNTSYYVRAYVTTSEGTQYGGQVSFTTSAPQNFILTINPIPTSGTIESTNVLGIKCGPGFSQCSNSFSAGTPVNLTTTMTGNITWTGCDSGSCDVTMNTNKTVSASSYICTGQPYNNYCWYKMTNLNSSTGISCKDFCSSLNKNCKSNYQGAPEDVEVLKKFGFSHAVSNDPQHCAFGNTENILKINSSNNYYVRCAQGGANNPMWSDCNQKRPWWGYICSCE